MFNPANMAVENEWNEGICGCFHDCGICCYGFCCTPCLFGSNAKKISDKNCFLMCCLYAITAHCYLCWIPHMSEREKMRKKYNLKEDPCGDCPTTLCCGPCALCQEAREMKSRENQPNVAYKAQPDAPIVAQPGAYTVSGQPGGYEYNNPQGYYPNNPQEYYSNNPPEYYPNNPQGYYPNNPQGYYPNNPQVNM